MNIVVLAGGLSPERDVSLSSGCMIANALMENGHKVLLADIYMGLRSADNFAGAYEKYKKDFYEYRIPEYEPDLEHIKRLRNDEYPDWQNRRHDELIGEGILPVCADADITFNALHGSIGENGQVPAVFDVYGIKYTGTGYEGCFLSMDKALAKDVMRIHGINTPDWQVIEINGNGCAGQLKNIKYPCVVKPCGCGSSVGVTMVDDSDGLDAAVKYARRYEDRIIIEPKITGREFSVGVLGDVALPPIEIIPKEGFFDYKNKYQPGATLEVCPANNLSREADELMRSVTLQVHKLLRLGDYSRLDAILDDEGRMYCLEINTLPGMTPNSLLPKEAAADGIAYTRLCERIVELALERYS